MCRWLVCAAALSLSACGTMDYSPPAYQPRGPEVDDGPYTTHVAVKGQERATGQFGPNLPMHAWRLESTYDKKTSQISRYIRFRNYYSAASWRYWDRAATVDGEGLSVVVVDRRVLGCYRGGCSFYEEVIAILPQSVIDRGDVDVRFSNRYDSGHIARYGAAEVIDLLHREADALATVRGK